MRASWVGAFMIDEVVGVLGKWGSMKIIAYLGVEADMAEGVAASGAGSGELWWFPALLAAVFFGALLWAVIRGLMEWVRAKRRWRSEIEQ